MRRTALLNLQYSGIEALPLASGGVDDQMSDGVAILFLKKPSVAINDESKMEVFQQQPKMASPRVSVPVYLLPFILF